MFIIMHKMKSLEPLRLTQSEKLAAIIAALRRLVKWYPLGKAWVFRVAW